MLDTLRVIEPLQSLLDLSLQEIQYQNTTWNEKQKGDSQADVGRSFRRWENMHDLAIKKVRVILSQRSSSQGQCTAAQEEM